MKILIGYDGSKDADAALEDLENAGLPAKARALILTVTSPWVPVGGPGGIVTRRDRAARRIAEDSLAQAQAMAEKAAAGLRARFPLWTIGGEALIDAPAAGLIAKAEAWKPDLIVLGCHGRTAIGRLLMGSVSSQVLHHAAADVRITRRRPGRKAPPKVIVAVDGSAGSDHAVAAAAARNWPAGTRLKVVAALEGGALAAALKGIKEAATGSADRLTAWIEGKSAAAERRLAGPGLKVSTVVKTGDPRLVLLREARDWGADCIFLGSRGLTGIERFVLGSVSASVAVHAPCTVEVVRKRRRSGREG